MNKKQSKFTLIILTVVFAAITALSSMAFTFEKSQSLSAQAEAAFCDEFIYNGGQGAQIDASYDVYYDSVNIYNKSIFDVPTYGNADPSYTNFCAPLAGTNVVVYYDQWKENLVPDFTPGMIVSGGYYRYFPDMRQTATKTLFQNMYTEMKTNVGQAGTSRTNFNNGLKSYITKAGYSVSTSSIYKSSTEVNLDKLAEAVDNNQVAVILCNTYNYVIDLYNNTAEKVVRVSKLTSTVGHIMMVYGYKKIEYYKDNSIFKTDYFLHVCNSYSDADKGYMQLNDFSNIVEAYIIDVN